MKKIYKAPSVNTVFVHTTQMLALSLDKYGSGSDGNVYTKGSGSEWGDIWSTPTVTNTGINP